MSVGGLQAAFSYFLFLFCLPSNVMMFSSTVGATRLSFDIEFLASYSPVSFFNSNFMLF